MSSLRLALKLSLQENPDAATTNEKQAEPFEALDAIGNFVVVMVATLVALIVFAFEFSRAKEKRIAGQKGQQRDQKEI